MCEVFFIFTHPRLNIKNIHILFQTGAVIFQCEEGGQDFFGQLKGHKFYDRDPILVKNVSSL